MANRFSERVKILMGKHGGQCGSLSAKWDTLFDYLRCPGVREDTAR